MKDLLDGADLEQVTMKTVCKQVSCHISLNSLHWYMYLLRLTITFLGGKGLYNFQKDSCTAKTAEKKSKP